MSKPDADALMAAILAAPADPLPRLVFVDYLDDTGTPANTTWAEYIRLRTAATGEVSALKRELMRDAARELAPRIVAGLTLPAADFLADMSHFLELLPVERFTVRLARFTPPRILPDVNVCRNGRGLPLTTAGPGVVGVIDPPADALRYWQQLIGFGMVVRVPRADLGPAIDRVYAPRSHALCLSQVTAAPVIPTLDDQLDKAPAVETRTFLEQLIRQARERGASAIDVTAYATHHWVRRVEGGRSLRWYKFGTAVGRELVRAARVLSGRRLGVRVRRRDSSFGEGVRIVLLNPPAPASVPVP